MSIARWAGAWWCRAATGGRGSLDPSPAAAAMRRFTCRVSATSPAKTCRRSPCACRWTPTWTPAASSMARSAAPTAFTCAPPAAARGRWPTSRTGWTWCWPAPIACTRARRAPWRCTSPARLKRRQRPSPTGSRSKSPASATYTSGRRPGRSGCTWPAAATCASTAATPRLSTSTSPDPAASPTAAPPAASTPTSPAPATSARRRSPARSTASSPAPALSSSGSRPAQRQDEEQQPERRNRDAAIMRRRVVAVRRRRQHPALQRDQRRLDDDEHKEERRQGAVPDRHDQQAEAEGDLRRPFPTEDADDHLAPVAQVEPRDHLRAAVRQKAVNEARNQRHEPRQRQEPGRRTRPLIGAVRRWREEAHPPALASGSRPSQNGMVPTQEASKKRGPYKMRQAP